VLEDSNTQAAPARFLRLPEVEHRVGLRKSSIYGKVKDGTFPAPLKLSSRAVCWPEADINKWMADCLQCKVVKV
jgi:prophage regulatory protein